VSARRNEILAAAAELFAEKGFAGTTVRDIADAVGILSGSLYHHFTAKEDMVEEIFTAYFDELDVRWDAILAGPHDIVEKFEAMLSALLDNVDSHTAAARLLTHDWLSLRHLGNFEERWDKIEKLWVKVIRQAVEEGKFRADIEPALLFSMAMDVIRGLSGWYHPGGRYSIGRVSKAYVGVLMTGMVTPDPAGAARGGAGAPASRAKRAKAG
jgi:AcrR family transcriptional regulator